MTRFLRVAALLTGLAGSCSTPVNAAQVILHPKVVTAGSVDCTSIEGIVHGVIRPEMTDEEKLLSLYHWFRQTVYHYRMMGADRRDVLRVLNSYGGLLCGSQSAVFRQLCHAAGLKARVVSGDGGRELGHTVVEVWYGGRWHVIDTMSSFYVRDRRTGGAIAGMADLAADPTLVTRAIEEGRCGPEFLYCVRHKDTGLAERRRMETTGMSSPDLPWTLFVIAPDADGSPQDILTFWTKGPRKPSYKEPEDAYGARYEPGLLDVTLKPNEEYVRLWDNTGQWMTNGNFEKVGPYHTCGRADEFDPVNFRYFEPYRKENVGYARYAYRYFANGWLEWRPKRDEILLGSAPENLNLDRSTGFLAAAGEPAVLRIPVKSPYAVVEAALEIQTEYTDSSAALTVACSPADDAYNHGIAPQVKTLRRAPGRSRVAFDVGRRKDVQGGVFAYELQIRVTGGRARFAVRGVKTTFMLNMYSLPFLTSGDNKVTVSADSPGPLQVSYEWAEGGNWTMPRRDLHVIRTFPSSYSIKVSGPKMPRMKRLVMRLAPSPRTASPPFS